jgi:predicted Fe-S protein YdhL (DUF1289 family)
VASEQTDGVWRRAEIESPCVKVCVVHPGAGLCVGCFRTPDEIAAWSRMTPEARRAVMAALPAREPLLTARGARASDRLSRRRTRG